MLASRSVQNPKPAHIAESRIAAIIYTDERYPAGVFASLVERCRADGMAVAGVLQHLAFEDADRRCDVMLEDLASGHKTHLFEDRGLGAKGCRLDYGALAEAGARIEASLETQPAALFLNKFGKVESEGGGLVDLIASAMDRGIPVLIGVPIRNLPAWRAFAGEFSTELPAELDEAWQWLSEARNSRSAIIREQTPRDLAAAMESIPD